LSYVLLCYVSTYTYITHHSVSGYSLLYFLWTYKWNAHYIYTSITLSKIGVTRKSRDALYVESLLRVPCNSFVMCKYTPWVMFFFVTCQHTLISLIIMFQAILSYIFFEHINETLVIFIQVLLFLELELQGKVEMFCM